MLMRCLTDAEMDELVDEQRTHDTWHAHRDAYARFAQDIYGPAVAIITLALGRVYNDEDYDPVVCGAVAYDAEAHPLLPDQSTAWWRANQHAAFLDARAYGFRGNTSTDYAIAYYAHSLPVPAGTLRTFVLARPPRRRLYPVYLPVAGQLGEMDCDAGERGPNLSGLREMTDEELRSLVEDYSEEWWNRWRRFARDLYGPRAHHVRIAVDRPRDGRLVPNATVCDVDRAGLEPDPDLPWWRTRIADRAGGSPRQDVADPGPLWFEERVRSYVGDIYAFWSEDDEPQILPVDRPPSRVSDVLYVAAGEGPFTPQGELDERTFPPAPLVLASFIDMLPDYD